MLALQFVTDSLPSIRLRHTYVLVVVALFAAAIAFVSIAPSLVAIAVVVAVAPGYLVSFFIAYFRAERPMPLTPAMASNARYGQYLAYIHGGLDSPGMGRSRAVRSAVCLSVRLSSPLCSLPTYNI